LIKYLELKEMDKNKKSYERMEIERLGNELAKSIKENHKLKKELENYKKQIEEKKYE
jgi:hypothetical protein